MGIRGQKPNRLRWDAAVWAVLLDLLEYMESSGIAVEEYGLRRSEFERMLSNVRDWPRVYRGDLDSFGPETTVYFYLFDDWLAFAHSVMTISMHGGIQGYRQPDVDFETVRKHMDRLFDMETAYYARKDVEWRKLLERVDQYVRECVSSGRKVVMKELWRQVSWSYERVRQAFHELERLKAEGVWPNCEVRHPDIDC